MLSLLLLARPRRLLLQTDFTRGLVYAVTLVLSLIHIYIHNDWSVLGRYLQDLKAPYILCEDTMASTCRPEHPIIDEQRKLPHFRLRQKFCYGYLYWGDYKRVTAVETECAAKTGLFPEKLREDSKSDRFHRLTRCV